MTDSELIHEYLNGSHDAFAQLVRRHADWVYSVARRQLRDADLAQDVAQAVLVVLARKAHRLGKGTILSAWLFQVTRLSVWRALRDRARRQRREALAASARLDELMHRTTGDERRTWSEIEPLLDESVARLRESDRTAVLLRFYQQKSFGEVGAAIGTTEDAARKRVGRAIERLREMLTARGASVSAIALPDLLFRQTTTSAPSAIAQLAGSIATEHARLAVLQLAKGAILMMTLQKVRMAILATLLVFACGALGTAMIRRATNSVEASEAQATTAPAKPHGGPTVNKVTQVVPILSVQDPDGHRLRIGSMRATAEKPIRWEK